MSNVEVVSDSLSDIIRCGSLRPVFQPIASLLSNAIYAHEGLIRGPASSSLEYPDALFRAATEQGLRDELEIACMQSFAGAALAQGWQGRLFLNFSARVLNHVVEQRGHACLQEWFGVNGVPQNPLTIELTEHDRVEDIEQLKLTVNALRAQGVSFALDDFGDGKSSLRLWAELQPEFVKIDKFFTKDLAQHPYKVQTLKALCLIAESLGGQLIAEGIEDSFAMDVVRDLGIVLGQGYFLGRPHAQPVIAVTEPALAAIARRHVAVYPEQIKTFGRDIIAERLLIPVPAVPTTTSNDEVMSIFNKHPDYHALAVTEEQRPVGLINRRLFVDRYTQPFHKELFGRRPCTVFMDPEPAMLEKTSTAEAMIALLTSEDQRYLTDGFIIVDQGLYLGLGTGEQLVRSVTEQRLQAARHANPLTFLPGNIPISEHIEKLLNSGNDFVACYCDLNYFKAFNDEYGYWRGDEMLRLLAGILVAHAHNRRDFVGHVGGDDFVVLFQSEDWEERCERIIGLFNHRARSLFEAAAIEKGGIHAEDRDGKPAFFPLTTLSIGAAKVLSGQFRRPEEVAYAASSAKRQVKRQQRSLLIVDATTPIG